MEDAGNLLTLYTNGIHAEQQWAQETQLKMDMQPPLTQDVNQLKHMIEPTMVKVHFLTLSPL